MLSVNDLKARFRVGRETIRAVEGVSWEVHEGQTLGVVGESGAGKSVTCLSLVGLLPRGAIVEGEAIFEGRDLLELSERELRKIRGRRIAMIFQDPQASLNPLLRVSTQLAEVTRHHLGYSAAEARAHALRMLELVGIPDPRARMDAYPYEFSGGMRQRVMVGMALACQPRLLIADEPTSALDVTVQAQILGLLRELRDKIGMAIILVTHDFLVVDEMADHVVVMYAGRVMESGPKTELMRDPMNPYSRALLRSIPNPRRPEHPLYQIGGQPPDPARSPQHQCPFADRCPEVAAECREKFPPFRQVGENHWSLCHFPAGGGGR